MKMINAICFILLVVFACNNNSSNNNINYFEKTKKDTIGVLKKHEKIKLEKNKFQEFEKLAKSEEEIPLDIVKKFVYINDSTLFENHSVFIGKGVITKKKYKLFFLKQAGKNEENYILITYKNNSNEQIDIKKILSFSKNKKTIVADIFFLSHSKNNEFVVNYFIQKDSNAMPDMENTDIRSKEVWKISTVGFFEKKL